MECVIKQLKNKLKVVFIPMLGRQSTSISIWTKVGGRYENENNLGISHFLEHLFFRGTKNRSAQEIKEAVEGIGGAMNAFTAEEFTCFYAHVPKGYTQKVIDVLCDIILNPLMELNDIKKERMIIAEEIRMYKDMPSYHVHDLLHEIMWPGHPLGRPLAGTHKSVNSISQRMLKNFKENFYQVNNMVLIVAGSLNMKEVFKEIKKGLGTLRPKSHPGFKKFFHKQRIPRVNFLNKDTEQTHLSIGFHGFRRIHPDRYILSVLNVILGGNMSSRLFQKIREEHGLAYQISSYIKRYQDTGAFIVNSGIKNKNVLDAVKLIMQELKKIKKEFLKKSELRKAKDFIAGQLLIGLEDTADRMLWAGEKIITNDPMLNIKDVLKKIKEVNCDDVKRVAKFVLKNNNLNLAIIGPLKASIKSVTKIVNDFD